METFGRQNKSVDVIQTQSAYRYQHQTIIIPAPRSGAGWAAPRVHPVTRGPRHGARVPIALAIQHAKKLPQNLPRRIGNVLAKVQALAKRIIRSCGLASFFSCLFAAAGCARQTAGQLVSAQHKCRLLESNTDTPLIPGHSLQVELSEARQHEVQKLVLENFEDHTRKAGCVSSEETEEALEFNVETLANPLLAVRVGRTKLRNLTRMGRNVTERGCAAAGLEHQCSADCVASGAAMTWWKV